MADVVVADMAAGAVLPGATIGAVAVAVAAAAFALTLALALAALALLAWWWLVLVLAWCSSSASVWHAPMECGRDRKEIGSERWGQSAGNGCCI